MPRVVVQHVFLQRAGQLVQLGDDFLMERPVLQLGAHLIGVGLVGLK